MHEDVDNDKDRCMVLEYLDTDLWSLRTRAQKLGDPFLKATAKSILEAVKVFSDMDGHITALHTGVYKLHRVESSYAACWLTSTC